MSIESEIEEVTTIINAVEQGDTVKALTLLRDRLYYLQEVGNAFEELDMEMEKALIAGVEDSDGT